MTDFISLLKEVYFEWHVKHTVRMWKLKHGLVPGTDWPLT